MMERADGGGLRLLIRPKTGGVAVTWVDGIPSGAVRVKGSRFPEF